MVIMNAEFSFFDIYMNEWHKQNESKPWQEHKFFKAQAFLFNVKILDILVQEKKMWIYCVLSVIERQS